MKELFFTTIPKSPKVIVNKFFFLCVCFLLFHAVRDKQLEPTYLDTI